MRKLALRFVIVYACTVMGCADGVGRVALDASGTKGAETTAPDLGVTPVSADVIVKEPCVPNCAGWQCGPDGCGGQCGTCPPGEECIGHQCQQGSCIPDCLGNECGPDGCDGICGDCGLGMQCEDGVCMSSALDGCSTYGHPGCDGCLCEDCVCSLDSYCCEFMWDAPCADLCDSGCEGCIAQAEGEFLDPCKDHSHCISGICIDTAEFGSVCTLQCVEECPLDWDCKLLEEVLPDMIFYCAPICEPNCQGMVCGSDGCGGNCGVCPDQQVCLDNGSCADSTTVCQRMGIVTSLRIGQGGHPGEALDVDEDDDTCSPAGDCENGLDNEVSGLFGQLEQFVDVDAEYEEMISSGELALLIRLKPAANGSIDLYLESGQPLMGGGDCAKEPENCTFVPLGSEYQGIYGDVALGADSLVAGGVGHESHFLCLAVPFLCAAGFGEFVGPANFIKVYNATIIMDFEAAGCDHLGQAQGIFAGGIHKQESIDAILELQGEDLPVSPEMLADLLDMFLTPDMDGDGDGIPELCSYGFPFEAVSTNIEAD